MASIKEEGTRVERAVTYRPESGIVVAPPKTATSIRTIPLVESTTNLLKALYRQRQKQYPNCFMATAFLFCKEGAPFEPRDPSAVSRRKKRFGSVDIALVPLRFSLIIPRQEEKRKVVIMVNRH